MTWKSLDRRTQLQLAGLAILVLGIVASVLLDWSASNDPGPLLGYDIQSDSAQPVRPQDSKKFMRELEQYNGKAGVLMYEFRTWFTGLWQGRTLARTLFSITVFSVAVLFYLAHRQPPPRR
jgi:hypothetical protein